MVCVICKAKRVRRVAHVAAAVAVASVFIMAGCSSGPRDFTNENDRLRKENLELEQEITKLQTSLDARLGEIQALRSKYETDPSRVPGAEPPVLSRIEFDRYTSAVDTNNDGRDDTIRVYLDTFDQNNRFLPISGRAVLQAAVIREGQEPYLIVNNTYDAKQVTDAYRSGMLGTHYSFESPLPSDLAADVDEVTVKMTVTDGATGATFTTQQALRLEP